jgi:diacylglycerol kinase (ATP)
MPPSTALILNPHARRLRPRAELGARIERAAEGRAQLFSTETRADLELACAKLASQPPDQVLVCGGDGTVTSAITALWRAFGQRPLPRLVLVPAGTVCTTARRWSGRVAPVRLVEKALAGALAATSRQPTLAVSEHGAETRLGFTFGTGLVARFFERYDAEERRGRLCAAAIVTRTLLGSVVGDAYARSVLEPVACTLRVDEADLPASAFSLVIASVLKNVGLGMRVTYRAGEDPMRPHVVASALAPRRLGPQLWRALLGLRLRGESGFDGLVRELGVRFPEPTSYVLDGDRFVASALTVRAGPVVEIAVP